MVYPKDIGEYDVIDLDNLDTKAFGDEITRCFSYDDNCRRLPTIIMYSIFTDELPKGFYTLFIPENDRVLSRKNVKKWLK